MYFDTTLDEFTAKKQTTTLMHAYANSDNKRLIFILHFM